MAELLLELLSEDIPARMQARAAEDLEHIATQFLTQKAIGYGRIESYVTPRRLVVVVKNVRDKQMDTGEEHRIRADVPEKAIQGFLRSAGLKSVDECEVREVKGNKFYFALHREKGRPTAELLPDIINDSIQVLNWPKSMRWGANWARYVRPLHGVLAIFDRKLLKGEYELGAEKLRFTSETTGHRFLAPEPFTVKDFADYKAKLKKAHVILDPAERRAVIWKEAQKLAKAEGLTVKEDEGLLAEVAGMVEWPKVFIGGIDQAFMDLPAEVLTTVMRHNQKYFSLVKKDGSLAPRFIVVADTEPDDGGKAITAGNERVLKARLADARFFWDHDRKKTLEGRVPALEEMIFHAKLGTLAEKVRRLNGRILSLAPYFPALDVDAAKRAAKLCKADLTTEMVGEFPELQGLMGRYYALGDGERPEVAEAIAEHYAPLGPSDRCPTAPVSVAVALADKIDTLCQFWKIGEKPTGSKDPFALRRAALGVIRLIIESGLRIPLRAEFGEFLLAGGVTGDEKQQIIDDLLDFFADRLKVHLREKGVRHDLIDAVFALGGEDDLVRLMARVEALEKFLKSEDGEHLLTAYKRASNIVRIEEKRDGVAYDGAADTEWFRQPEERDLHDRLGQVKAESDAVVKEERFDDAMKTLAGLRTSVDVFFDEVTVNCDEAELRENRLKLLSEIRATMNTVADFSKIEG